MKRKLNVLMVLVMIITLLVTSCGQADTGSGAKEETKTETKTETSDTGSETEVEVKEEPVELTLNAMVLQANFSGFQDDEVIKKMEEDLNVKLNIIPQNAVGDIVAKFSAQLAANDFEDIVFVPSDIDRAEIMPMLVSSGAMLPLDNLLDQYGTDIKANLSEMLERSREKLSVDVDGNNDGNLYFINLKTQPNATGAELDVATRLRWDLYAELGYPEINDMFDYIPILKDMMALEPENKDGQKNYGVSGWFANPGGWGAWFLSGFSFQMGERGIGSVGYTDLKSGEYKSLIDDDEAYFWQAVKWYNKANQEGVLDPDAFTNKFPDYKQNVATANRVFLGWAGWNIDTGNAAFIADGEPNKGFVNMPSAFPERDYQVFNFYFGDGRFPMFISSNCEHPEKAMEVLNYLASYEGSRLIYNGIEGVHWDVVDGVPMIKDEVVENFMSDPDYTMASGFNKYFNMAGLGSGTIDPEYGVPIQYLSNPITQKENLSQVTLDALEYYGVEVPSQMYDDKRYVNLDLSLIQGITLPEDLKVIDTNIKNYIFTEIYPLIIAETDEEFEVLKKNFIETIYGMGAQQLHDYYLANEDLIKNAVSNSERKD